MHDLYHRDPYMWAKAQVEALRKRDLDAIDWTHVIEELQDIADQWEDELKAHYGVILELLLDLQFGIDGRLVSQVEVGIGQVRHDVTIALHWRPGLRERREELFAQAWDRMRPDAFVEVTHKGWDQVIPRDNPYTLRQVEDFNWWPPRP